MSRENTPIQKLPSPLHQSVRDKIPYIPRPSYMTDEDDNDNNDEDGDGYGDVDENGNSSKKYRQSGSIGGSSSRGRRDEFEDDKRLDTIDYTPVYIFIINSYIYHIK